MLRIREITAPLDFDREFMVRACAGKLGVRREDILSVKLVKRATDARKKSAVCFKITVDVSVRGEEKILRRMKKTGNISKAPENKYIPPESSAFRKRPVVVGLGPAGIFAAYTLALAGARPVILERGRDVDSRAESVRTFWEEGRLDPESNVQFGEGGAGAFSDGKLTTGTKDERIPFVFETLVECGAPEDILFLAKPHVGTDRLRPTIRTLRERIIRLGGEVVFGARLTDIGIVDGKLAWAEYEKDGTAATIDTDTVILAVGHSARDTFSRLRELEVPMERKTFAVGVRIEHKQDMINRSLYGDFADVPGLGGDYKLVVHPEQGRSVYTFCMCPGGRVVAAASEAGGVVTNGMSDYARDGDNANSALLVNVNPEDLPGSDPLAGIEFQREIERAAFKAGGGDYCAPVTRVGEFLGEKPGDGCTGAEPTYRPGVRPARVEDYLPYFVCEALRQGIPLMGRKITGFDSPGAVLTGVESRSSCPLRIVRDGNCESIGVKGLYPCGEGAGYAGGIVSAAVDGIRCAQAAININAD